MKLLGLLKKSEQATLSAPPRSIVLSSFGDESYGYILKLNGGLGLIISDS